ncbi:GNAT family N-acetyltransferase [Paenibacillus xylanilyticus]|uniref:GNAT family N-acetyltransferase n=1 Tax=Paenibacillus xylanilyticus TaxID=248903 RepID=UPI00399F859D
MEKLIHLTMYHERYDEALARFSLTGEQFTFTALPAEVIDEAISNPDKFPIVILKEETPVGFFILHKNSEYAEGKRYSNAILIRALSITSEHQGKGYALAAMNALTPLLQQIDPEMKEVILAVNEQNVAAQSLYLKAGFRDTGIRRIGAHGLQFVFHRTVD